MSSSSVKTGKNSGSPVIRDYAGSMSVWKRDEWKCRYCGADLSKWPDWLNLTIDHVIPKNSKNRAGSKPKGDIESTENKVTACRSCNTMRNQTAYKIPSAASFEEQIKIVFEEKKEQILQRRNDFMEFYRAHVAKQPP